MAIAAGALAGCAGASGPVRPKPLQYHLEEHHLAGVADKKDVEAARAELARAVEKSRKAESDQASSKRALDEARREASRAAEEKEAADRKKSSAEESKDWQLQNKVTRDQRVAEVTLQAAEKKVTMMEARRDWLDEWVTWTRENVFAVEARFELAKATLARAHNIAPPDFAYQAFVDQAERRRARADKLKPAADEAEQIWLAARKEWEAKRRDEMEARGLDTDTAAAKADADDRQ
jgi:hypothetical protein